MILVCVNGCTAQLTLVSLWMLPHTGVSVDVTSHWFSCGFLTLVSLWMLPHWC